MPHSHDQEEQSPIFVVGMPRSGTTLMRFMLCAHPAISIAPETNYLNRWMRFFSHLDFTNRKHFEIFWEEFRSIEMFRAFDINPDATYDRILAAGSHDHRTVFSCIAQEYAAGKNKQRWGEKTPKHELHLDLLLQWYPQARVFYMLRDPRAVTLSRLGQSDTSSFVHSHAERWRKSARSARIWAEDERIQVVYYEKLVLDPEPILRKACEFLNEDFAPAMIDRTDVSGYVLYPRDAAGKKALPVLGKLNPASLDKWRSGLSQGQVSVVQHIAGDEMRRHGYSLIGSPLSSLQRGRLLLDRLQAPMEALRQEPVRQVISTRLRTHWKRIRG